MSTPSILAYPPHIPLNDLKPKYGGPCRTQAYELIAQRKLNAVKRGKLTLVTGESFAAYMASLPAYEPKVSA